MKVAYFSRHMFSDVDLSLLMQAQHMADIDYYVPIFKNYIKGAAFNLQKAYPRSGIFRATDIYPELKSCSRLIDENRFFIVNSPVSHGWDPSNLWLYIKFAWRLRKYDVIHITDFPRYYELPLFLLRRKTLLTVHDPIPHSAAQSNTKMILRARRRGFRLLKHFLILNAAQKEECIQINRLQRKHIYDSRLGRYDYLRMYADTNRQQGDYCLFFGQITSNKGLDTLLPAMEKVHRLHPDLRLIVAGKGKFHFDIAPYQDKPYIEFRNRFIPDDELANLIQEARFALCPYDDATQSGVVMSAFAFNKPIIATNVGGLPEQVLHDRYGLIVPPRDADALAQAMDTLCEQPDKLDTYARNIEQDYAQGEKSWHHIAQGLIQIYRQITNP